MEERTKSDRVLLTVVVVLVAIGTVMIYSASSFKAEELSGDSSLFLKKQLFRVLLGLALMLVVINVDYHFFLKIAPVLLVLSILGLLYLLTFSAGVVEVKGSARWINIYGFMFQPSDVAKYALVLFLSRSLVDRDRLKDSSKGFIPQAIFIASVIVLILLEPDMGTAAIVFLIALAMLFLAGAKIRHLIALGLSSLGVICLTMLLKFGYQWERILQYIGSVKGVRRPSWQVLQSLISLGNGGFFGLGLGNSKQKFHFLPQPFTDFIFSIVGEELGFLGVFLVLILFLVLMWRGIRIATKAPDRAGRLLALGITTTIITYAFFNAGVISHLLPTTGIPMPFISYGGSSLVMNLLGVGILLNISSQIREVYPVSRLRPRPRRRF